MKQKSSPWLVTLGAFAFYSLAFRPFYDQLSQAITALALFPVLAAVLSFGMSGGLLAAAALIPLDLLLYLYSGEPSTAAIAGPDFWATHLILLVVALVTGYFQVLTNRLGQELDESEAIQQRLSHLATHDPLTNLPNRVLLFDRANIALARAKREHGKVALLFFDLDEFKRVNDTYGHEVGDQTLVILAQRLKQSLRETDTVSRLGGDEFLILVEGVSKPKGLSAICKKLLSNVAKPIAIENAENNQLKITASIGISLYPQDGQEIDELIKKADAAMYKVKRESKNNYAFYSSSDTQRKMPGF
jgi:diguanylate cyclase (GGDEF)-like protein